MSDLDFRKCVKSRVVYTFYTLVSLFFLILMYENKGIYKWTLNSVNFILSIIIIFSIVSTEKQEYESTCYIELGCIISSLLITGSLFIGKDFISFHKMLMVSGIVEVLSFGININYLNKEKKYSSREITKYFIKIFLLCIILFALDFKAELININKITIHIADLVLVLVLAYLIYNLKAFKKNDDIGNSKFLVIKRIMKIKILSFIIILVLPKIGHDGKYVHILIEWLSLLQIYLIYKIIIYARMINPYIRIKQINEVIKDQENIEQDKNIILKNIKDVQYEIKEEVKYKEGYLNSIFSCSVNGCIIFGEKKEIVYVNSAFKKIVGSKGDAIEDILEAINKNIVDKDDFLNCLIDSYNEKVVSEKEILTRDNGIYRCTYIPQIQEKECVCIFDDITKEKEILNNLIALNEEYEDLIINIKSPVFIADENNNIIKSSKSYESIFDSEYCDVDEEKFINEVVHIDYRDKYRQVSEINKRAKSNDELYNEGFFRYAIVNGDGQTIWLESNTTVYYDEGRKYNIMSYSDITKYIEAIDYLKKTESMYIALLDSIPEGIYMEDLDTNKYIFINKKFKDMFSIDPDINVDDLGICRKDLMKAHPDSQELIDKEISIVRKNKVFNYANIKYIDKNNNIINTRAASIPFKFKNKTLKLTIIKDMKDIKKLEMLRKKIYEREQKDNLKMEFFISMSHELKTPLNLIFTSAQLLETLIKKGKITDKSKCIHKHVALVKSNTFRLIKIIENLIELTKMESGFYKVKLEEKDIVSLIEDMVMSLVSYADNKGIKLIFDTDIEELFMMVDVNAIEIIILNILSNSIKFTNTNGHIYVDLMYINSKVNIIIRDTGIGIPENKIGFIFDRFNDVNKDFAGNMQGSGIGLSMVKSMANLIGADIKVESEVGYGTKFTITLDIKTPKKSKYIDENDIMPKIEKLIIDID